MADNARRRNTVIIVVLVLLLIALALLLPRCLPKKPAATPSAQQANNQPSVPAASSPAASEPATTLPAEVLTAATVTAPERVVAGAAFAVSWTGPDNRGDFLTIVPVDSPADKFTDYRETSAGASFELTAPVEPGKYEVRYVTDRTRTILGRAPVEVIAAGATINAPAEVVLGSKFEVTWTGPDNQGDYITIAPSDWPDDRYSNFTNVREGSPLTLTAPTETGELELRYITGQGHKVLARRAIKVLAAEVALGAPDEAIAGSTIAVTWTGPNNSGDYITVVEKALPDGQYRNYTNTASGSPLNLLLPVMDGEAEIRYMTGQGGKVLARRSIKIKSAVVTLAAAAEAKIDGDVSITWTGPDNPGDYITIVPKGTPDGEYRAYANTTAGSPLTVKALKDPGEAEIRYMTGQGGKVLARIAIKIVS